MSRNSDDNFAGLLLGAIIGLILAFMVFLLEIVAAMMRSDNPLVRVLGWINILRIGDIELNLRATFCLLTPEV